MKKEEGVPAIFTDPIFAKSSHWSLSTSQLTSEFFEGWGYGEGKNFDFFSSFGLLILVIFVVVEDGYGLAYAVNNRSLRFTITSMNKAPKSARKA